MLKKMKKLIDMVDEERWQAFEVEILHYVIFDGEIEAGEKVLIDSIAPLYFTNDETLDIPPKKWDEINNRLNERTKGVSSTEKRRNTVGLQKIMLKNIINRLLEPQHKNLSREKYHWFCDWLLNLHNETEDYWVFPDIKHKGDFLEKTLLPSFQLVTHKEDIADYPSKVISSSYDKWKQTPVPPEAIYVQLVEQSLVENLRHILDLSISDQFSDELVNLLSNTDNIFNQMPFSLENCEPVWFINDLDSEQEIWFAGDVHGDLLAFEAVCQCFEEYKNKNAKLIFLGDLVDRGAHHLEVVYSLLTKIKQSPDSYGWIAGNHDIGLKYSSDKNEFVSRTTPAEFTTFLNEHLGDDNYLDIGKGFIALAEKLPQAVFFPGLLATHGGFPHSDLWDMIKQPSDLMGEQCLIDFTHNRVHHSKKKFPNRMSHSSQFGSEDFSGFRNACHKIGIKVNSMVRGHDHVSEQTSRWDRPEQVRRGDYESRVLTINSLSYTQTGELNTHSPSDPRQPVIARWKNGDVFPTPYVIDLSSTIVKDYSKPCGTCKKPTIENTCTCNTVVKMSSRNSVEYEEDIQ